MAALMGGCGDDSPTSPQLARCASRPTLTASAGTIPEFTWTPDCLVTSVAVMEVGSTGPMRWVVRVPEPTLGSPHLFGAVPEGGTEHGSGEPLEIGVTYRALLGMRISATTDSVVTSVVFTP